MEHSIETPIPTRDQDKLLVAAKCAHDRCTCMTTAGKLYCSDYCAEWASAASRDAGHECGCGHVECAHAARRGI